MGLLIGGEKRPGPTIANRMQDFAQKLSRAQVLGSGGSGWSDGHPFSSGLGNAALAGTPFIVDTLGSTAVELAKGDVRWNMCDPLTVERAAELSD